MRSKPLVDLITSPWAILPEKLAEIQSIYAAHVRGDAVDIAAIEAKLGRPLASEQQSYTVASDGVATLEVNGVMAPKANLFMQISGGVSTQMLAAQFNSMRADARVRSAIIVWDSPGGQVHAVPAAAAALQALAGDKPTVSLVRGVMASAAYWVGSAANAVFLEGPTDIAGSLGVYQRISWDNPDPNSMDLVRGEYKRATLNGQGPSAKFLEQANTQLDYMYTVLVDAVAQHRGTTSDLVLQHMADGRIFTGALAVQAGLADGMATHDDLADRLATAPDTYRTRRKARIGATAALSFQHEGAPRMAPENQPAAMSREALERDHPALFLALSAEFTAAGASAERARIQAVRAQALPGHEALIDRLAFDGTTSGPEAAVAVLQAERELASNRQTALAQDVPQPLPADASQTAAGGAADTEATTTTPMENARSLADAITKKQAEAKALGQTLSATAALALINKERSHG